MTRLQCPRCETTIDPPAQGDPVCPSCGFTAPAQGRADSSGTDQEPAKTGRPTSSAYRPGTAGEQGVHYTPPPPGTSQSFYAQQPVQQQGYAQARAAAPTKTSGMAVASLVFGLVSVCTMFIAMIPFVGWFSLVPSVLAIVFGGVAMNQCNKDASISGRGMAVAGLVLGIIVAAFGLMFRVIFAGF